ncbi:MAG: 1-acyl-sn-glycerol-3-phosphate acyltransferase [Paludibacteraceae bacterium]|nr:1-acyl-sn-glycerol-3-phosphate acyltransferase [Paludibacteraceae bacterium]
MRVAQRISRFILKCIGWKANLNVEIPKKCVLVVAPHTSNWDFIVGELMYQSISADGNVNFLIKKEWLKFPFKYIIGPLGGVAVDRGHSNSLVNQMVAEYEKRDVMRLAITPEGTRKANSKWKRGFYHISRMANVPILLVYLDYGKKEAGIEKVFVPTGDEEADIQFVKDYFANFTAKYPDKFVV